MIIQDDRPSTSAWRFRAPRGRRGVLREGRIGGHAAADPVYEDVATEQSEDPAHYAAARRAPFEALLAELGG